jgi:gamma-glutamylcyclotransferase (GGCT)/AIG2-like uncharacterized protein YtfP
MRVFVYGTLKRGSGNQHNLGDSTFIGAGQTVAHCRLFDAGFPVLRRRDKRQPCAPVRGEVYECDDLVIQNLDRLESEGRMYHRRMKRIRLDDENGGATIEAAVYVGDTWFWKHKVRQYPLDGPCYDWSHRDTYDYAADDQAFDAARC